jgi:O-methyltransferase involved in polyketide biosynthesis
VVIIAAGYDTRAYRLGKPGVKFYEIDLPHASEKKQELVKKHMPAEKVSHWLSKLVSASLILIVLSEQGRQRRSWSRSTCQQRR